MMFPYFFFNIITSFAINTSHVTAPTSLLCHKKMSSTGTLVRNALVISKTHQTILHGSKYKTDNQRHGCKRGMLQHQMVPRIAGAILGYP